MTKDKPKKINILSNLFPWIDGLALLTWGSLLLKYWSTGEIMLLIHPNYIWLVVWAGLTLTVMASLKLLPLAVAGIKGRWQRSGEPEEAHIALFPPGFGSSLLVVVAVWGLLTSPKVLASDAALQRGVTETFSFTRAQPQSFRAAIKPEERSIIDWVRTLNAYPEPDAYTGQKVNVTGFVVYSPELPKQYLLISRFILTCCAVDAYPVGIPVQIEGSTKDYPADSWLEIQGTMTTEQLAGKRKLAIVPSEIKSIPTPKNPYDY